MEAARRRGKHIGRPCRYGQLKLNWADFVPRAGNMNAEISMSYEFMHGLIFGQIHLT